MRLSLIVTLLISLLGISNFSGLAEQATDEDLQATIDAQATQIAELSSTPAGEVAVYSVDWESDLSSWATPLSWKVVDGVVVTDGTDPERGRRIAAPLEVGTANYAVEVDIQFISRNRDSDINCVDAGFGLFSRGNENGAYYGGVLSSAELCLGGIDEVGVLVGWRDQDTLLSSPYSLDHEWHTYRMEVEGTQVRVYVDGRLVGQIVDTQHLEDGTVGLWCNAMRIAIGRFEVYQI